MGEKLISRLSWPLNSHNRTQHGWMYVASNLAAQREEDMTHMLKQLVLATALSLSTAMLAMAQEAPKSADDCFKMSTDLFMIADAQKLAKDRKDQIETMLEKMETYCDAKQFAEAASVAKEVKATIGAK